MIRFKHCAMCLYGAQKWRRVAAVAVGEQEAETWRQSLQSQIQKVLGSIMYKIVLGQEILLLHVILIKIRDQE